MVTTIQADKINLHDLKTHFGLTRSDDEQFFREWQDNLPELSKEEILVLNDIRKDYFHLAEYPLLEPIVKMVVLSPLLKLAGFYHSPFYLAAEKAVEIVSEDEGTIIKGRLDLLVFTPEFWILVIEAKGAKYSLEVGIPQTLSYMLSNPHPEKPALGFVTNGREFQFLKLIQKDLPKYAMSDLFSLYRSGDLYPILKILKPMANLVSQ